MERSAMEQRSIKIEMPIPRLPRSSIFRYSLKTLAFITTVVAVAMSCYRLGGQKERARQTDGHLHFIASAPFGMSHASIPIQDISDLEALILKAKHSLARQSTDETWAELWPPEVWVTRADWNQPTLETRIEVDCGGSENAPKFDTSFFLEQGDRVFVNFGNRRLPAVQSDLTSSTKNSQMSK
jgi:hypothetical protein